MEEVDELETKFFKEGFAKGVTNGERLGFENGLKHGKEDGHQTGFEVGFAQGIAEATKIIFASNQDLVRSCDALLQSVGAVQLDKPPPPQVLQRVRARFKVVEARAGLSLSSHQQSQDISF
jgi:flagellar biosynthesis/type III secretory pathway protein FliH